MELSDELKYPISRGDLLQAAHACEVAATVHEGVEGSKKRAEHLRGMAAHMRLHVWQDNTASGQAAGVPAGHPHNERGV